MKDNDRAMDKICLPLLFVFGSFIMIDQIPYLAISLNAEMLAVSDAELNRDKSVSFRQNSSFESFVI